MRGACEGEPLVLRGGYMGPRSHGRFVVVAVVMDDDICNQRKCVGRTLSSAIPTFRLMAT